MGRERERERDHLIRTENLGGCKLPARIPMGQWLLTSAPLTFFPVGLVLYIVGSLASPLTSVTDAAGLNLPHRDIENCLQTLPDVSLQGK